MGNIELKNKKESRWSSYNPNNIPFSDIPKIQGSNRRTEISQFLMNQNRYETRISKSNASLIIKRKILKVGFDIVGKVIQKGVINDNYNDLNFLFSLNQELPYPNKSRYQLEYLNSIICVNDKKYLKHNKLAIDKDSFFDPGLLIKELSQTDKVNVLQKYASKDSDVQVESNSSNVQLSETSSNKASSIYVKNKVPQPKMNIIQKIDQKQSSIKSSNPPDIIIKEQPPTPKKQEPIEKIRTVRINTTTDLSRSRSIDNLKKSQSKEKLATQKDKSQDKSFTKEKSLIQVKKTGSKTPKQRSRSPIENKKNAEPLLKIDLRKAYNSFVEPGNYGTVNSSIQGDSFYNTTVNNTISDYSSNQNNSAFVYRKKIGSNPQNNIQTINSSRESNIQTQKPKPLYSSAIVSPKVNLKSDQESLYSYESNASSGHQKRSYVDMVKKKELAKYEKEKNKSPLRKANTNSNKELLEVNLNKTINKNIEDKVSSKKKENPVFEPKESQKGKVDPKNLINKTFESSNKPVSKGKTMKQSEEIQEVKPKTVNRELLASKSNKELPNIKKNEMIFKIDLSEDNEDSSRIKKEKNKEIPIEIPKLDEESFDEVFRTMTPKISSKTLSDKSTNINKLNALKNLKTMINKNTQKQTTFDPNKYNTEQNNEKDKLSVIRESVSNEGDESNDRFSFQRRQTPKFDRVTKQRSNSQDPEENNENILRSQQFSFNEFPQKKVICIIIVLEKYPGKNQFGF
jgi:hypothetical protein